MVVLPVLIAATKPGFDRRLEHLHLLADAVDAVLEAGSHPLLLP